MQSLRYIGQFALIVGTMLTVAAYGDDPPTSFDDCMQQYSPPAGPNLGFMAAKAACHTYFRSKTSQQRAAALCVASEAKVVKTSRDFDNYVKDCFGRTPVGSIIAQMQCIMPNYPG